MKTFLALSFALLAVVSLALSQNFSVEITPLSAVVLPDTGGTISYRVTVTNQEAVPRTADLWVQSTLPDGSTKSGPGPTTQTFLGNQTLTWERQQTLLPASPVGYYTLHAYVGLYPNTVWVQADLECQKQVLTGGVEQEWVARYNGTGNETDDATGLTVDENGYVYVTGYSAQNEIWPWNFDYITIKYNASGVLQWLARYNGLGNDDDYTRNLIVDEYGNVYVTGSSYGSGTGWDYATIKYNDVGEQQWVARYNGPGNGEDRASSLALDGDGNVLVTGYSVGSGTGVDYATIKYDSLGAQQWVALYNGLGSDFARSLAVDLNNNVYVTGGSDGEANADYVTIKYDAYGWQMWVARYNDPGNGADMAHDVAVDSIGNVFVTGSSWGGYLTGLDYETVMYDPTGIQLWEARYSLQGNWTDEATDLALGANGSVYVTGHSPRSGTGDDYATIKYNSAGDLQWVARYNGPINQNDQAASLVLDENSNVYVTGQSDGSRGSDYATIKYNPFGAEQWVARYNGPLNYNDEAHALAVDQNGNVYVTGYCTAFEHNYDFATLKYSQPDLPDWQPVTATMLGVPLPQECRLEAPSPNPFNPTTNIRFQMPDARNVSLRIYDTSGRLVTTPINGWREAGTHEVTFDGSMLASGMYFVKMQAGGFSAVQKIVLLK